MRYSDTVRLGSDYLNYELKDGYGDFGGVPRRGYTLEDYLREISDDEEDFQYWAGKEIWEINYSLVVESGIAPIPWNLEEERRQLACIAAFYAGSVEYAPNRNPKAFIEWADQYDFKMLDRNHVDMEEAKKDAMAFAKCL